MSPVPVRLKSLGNRARPKSVIQTAPWRIDQEVGRLDVAMEDAQAMGVVQRIGRLDAQPGDVAAEGPVLMDRPDGRRRRDGRPPPGRPRVETSCELGVIAPVDRAGLVADRRSRGRRRSADEASPPRS